MPRNSQGCCAHDHDCEAADCGPAYSLYKHINFSSIWALNEATVGSARGVFREWQDRLDFDAPPLVSNDEDPELLIHVPFDGLVKLKAICIIGGTDGMAPSEMKAYINRDDLDFGSVADLPPIQKWDLQENLRGEIEYPTQVTKFNGVHSIDLHLPSSFGADVTKIHFIGFKGEFQKAKREAVATVYESKAMLSDHEVKNDSKFSHQIF